MIVSGTVIHNKKDIVFSTNSDGSLSFLGLTIIPVNTEVIVLGFSDTKRKSESLFFKDKSIIKKNNLHAKFQIITKL